MTIEIVDIIAHTSLIIDRQQEDFEQLITTKPRPVTQIQKAKGKLIELREFRDSLLSSKITNNQMMDSMISDMKSIGWAA